MLSRQEVSKNGTALRAFWNWLFSLNTVTWRFIQVVECIFAFLAWPYFRFIFLKLMDPGYCFPFSALTIIDEISVGFFIMPTVRSVEFWLQKETLEDFIKDMIILKYIFKQKKSSCGKKLFYLLLIFFFLTTLLRYDWHTQSVCN